MNRHSEKLIDAMYKAQKINTYCLNEFKTQNKQNLQYDLDNTIVAYNESNVLYNNKLRYALNIFIDMFDISIETFSESINVDFDILSKFISGNLLTITDDYTNVIKILPTVQMTFNQYFKGFSFEDISFENVQINIDELDFNFDKDTKKVFDVSTNAFDFEIDDCEILESIDFEKLFKDTDDDSNE